MPFQSCLSLLDSPLACLFPLCNSLRGKKDRRKISLFPVLASSKLKACSYQGILGIQGFNPR